MARNLMVSRAGYKYYVEVYKPVYVKNEKLLPDSKIDDIFYAKIESDSIGSIFIGQTKQNINTKIISTKDDVKIKPDYYVVFDDELYIVASPVDVKSIKSYGRAGIKETIMTIRRAV